MDTLNTSPGMGTTKRYPRWRTDEPAGGSVWDIRLLYSLFVGILNPLSYHRLAVGALLAVNPHARSYLQMTNEEIKIIADVLRNRINEITKLFREPGAHVLEANVAHAMKVQIAYLAKDLDFAFCEKDSTFRAIFLDAVRAETKVPSSASLPVVGYASGDDPSRP